ncbi:hypothetical protein NMY22_g15355 [Coprinellus aureogranulatus]|nr:hypothetical protein NMY22_g15355 [Coprinellus aureogranulatus]
MGPHTPDSVFFAPCYGFIVIHAPLAVPRHSQVPPTRQGDANGVDCKNEHRGQFAGRCAPNQLRSQQDVTWLSSFHRPLFKYSHWSTNTLRQFPPGPLIHLTQALSVMVGGGQASATGKESRQSGSSPQSQSGHGKPTKRPTDDSGDGLHWAPPKKQCRTDPLVGHGKHYGRTVRTFCHMQTIIAHGLSRTMQLELGRISEEDLTHTQVHSFSNDGNVIHRWCRSDLIEQRLYRRLLSLSPGLEERLNTGSEEEIHYIANTVTKGISQAKSDDTKSLKSAVIDWITPPNEVLKPPLPPKCEAWPIRRELANGQIVPTGDLWPRFIYRNYEYNSEDAWDGLLRSSLLAFKHVFTSPSSVDAEVGVLNSTRSCNARIHGMTAVTVASIAYITTQVRFALLASNVFSQADKVTDSEGFYRHLIDLLEDEEEQEEVASLLKWWNQQIFPALVSHTRLVNKDSVIAKVKERRRLIKEGLWKPSRPASELRDQGEVTLPAHD